MAAARTDGHGMHARPFPIKAAALPAQSSILTALPETPYARVALALIERLAIGDVVFLSDAELQRYHNEGHLSATDAASCRAARGFMPVATFRRIVKSTGADSVGRMASVPLGAWHLISKQHSKVLMTELAERRKEARGGVRNVELIERRHADALAAKKKIDEKAAKDAAKETMRLEKEAAKIAARQDKEGAKEKKLLRRASSRKNKSKLESRDDKASEPTRRQTLEKALFQGARAATQLDMHEATTRWLEHPEHTRYQATTAVQARELGYLSFERGDLINVTEKADNGYYTGVLARSGEQGIFPGHVVQFAGTS